MGTKSPSPMAKALLSLSNGLSRLSEWVFKLYVRAEMRRAR